MWRRDAMCSASGAGRATHTGRAHFRTTSRSRPAFCAFGGSRAGALETRLPLDELEAEAALDAEVALRHVVVVGRRDVDDLTVLHVQLEVAADAAVPADGRRHLLARLVPRACLAVVVLALRHERAGGADGNAVAAVDAGRLRQGHVELGRDVCVEASAGDGDGERVLVVDAARLDAAVAEDALRVVADVEVVVDLHLVLDTRRVRPEAPGVGLVALDVLERGGSRGEVDRRAEQLEHEAPRDPNALRVGEDDHAWLRLARARRHERSRSLQLDNADAA